MSDLLKPNTLQRSLKTFVTPRDWIFGYPTRLVDRAVDYVEEILLPESMTPEGLLHITTADTPVISTCKDAYGLRKKLVYSIPGASQTRSLRIEDQVTIDLRYKYPQNWAHALTNHLPLALIISEALELQTRNVTLIFPLDISTTILHVFRLSGFRTINTDRPVISRNCHYELSPWTSIRGTRTEIIKQGLSSSPLLGEIRSSEKLFDKIYIARKNTRSVINEAELDSLLSSKGFRKVYMEDHSGVEQLALIFNASSIVAVHGAALGPLIFKIFSDKPYKLIEIFSPAHITDVYRVISHQTGGNWAAIRGKIWPSLLKDSANFSSNLENFFISTESLQMAMSHLDMS